MGSKDNIATDKNQMHTDRNQRESHFHLCASDFYLWLKFFAVSITAYLGASVVTGPGTIPITFRSPE
jgi:hypothetical protein